MIDFVASVHVIDLILAIVIAEFLAISGYWVATHRGIAPAALFPNLLAGALLLLALRFALSGLGWPWIVACLALSGVANAADLRQRWR